MDPEDPPQETFLVASGTGNCNNLPGMQEAIIASQILKLVQPLSPKTKGVSDIRKGALALAHAAGAKLGKAE